MVQGGGPTSNRRRGAGLTRHVVYSSVTARDGRRRQDRAGADGGEATAMDAEGSERERALERRLARLEARLDRLEDRLGLPVATSEAAPSAAHPAPCSASTAAPNARP